MHERPVVVVGGGNSAGQAALHLAKYASHVTIVIRGSSLLNSMSQYLITEIEASPCIDLITNAEVMDASGEPRLESVSLRDRRTGDVATYPAQGMFIMIGAEPCSSWLNRTIACDPRGFVLTGQGGSASDGTTISSLGFDFQTSTPGVFAVGDVRSGSVKRVASAVGEGSMVVQQVHEYLLRAPSRIALAAGSKTPT
jgi:thioredoxin reductase (NADPH)